MHTPMETPETDPLAVFARALAESATPMALSYFRTPLDIEKKEDLSPVTKADRSIESAMRAQIIDRFPGHGIYGEEHGSSKLDSPNIWVLDPIDGTKSFITGMPAFGTLVAHLEHGKPTIGVISIPPTGEIWVGQTGAATQFCGQGCRTSGCTRLADARLYTTSPDSFDAEGLAIFDRISARAAMRRFGGDCYTYGLLASGHVDAVVEMDLQPYDYLALVPVIEGAGGVITDWNGAPLGLDSSGRVVAAATPELHAEILSMTRG
ncbi:inositol monophosphatase family protein [Antarcticimicrobium sediminis]|uniref:Histidinol phosphate phosphatase n=1 Tax=Antarcticimicrobium sediminis TaxID=2546227 RepID=A0A4R5EY59_9RHOB|nr:inositol monophosphatase family protein [Antarcticimicrobium sediminis]TDE40028.1 histidinol phosphate phosphatase [Antarcticimicrobium sediminis]